MVSKGELPGPRAGHSMTPLPGEEDCFLIFGGNANGTRLADLHRAEVGRSAAAWDRPCNDCDETCEVFGLLN